eukprot:TRINITY_DN3813_c1_g1_i6.p2 TRINITY_DN3813_c1_g1~~TRINITY_DN3813_c1_g1_i6.p2  ORF type:complete len:185 (-),score=-12.37 TRINITY_DN3813_c1_g1_i6:182-736(-)
MSLLAKSITIFLKIYYQNIKTIVSSITKEKSILPQQPKENYPTKNAQVFIRSRKRQKQKRNEKIQQQQNSVNLGFAYLPQISFTQKNFNQRQLKFFQHKQIYYLYQKQKNHLRKKTFQLFYKKFYVVQPSVYLVTVPDIFQTHIFNHLISHQVCITIMLHFILQYSKDMKLVVPWEIRNLKCTV